MKSATQVSHAGASSHLTRYLLRWTELLQTLFETAISELKKKIELQPFPSFLNGLVDSRDKTYVTEIINSPIIPGACSIMCKDLELVWF